MPEETDVTTLQTKLNDALQRIDDLEYLTNKKLGASSNSIYGSLIQSVNFKTGTSGWQLTPDGNFEGNNGNFRGDITGATGTFSGTVTVGSLNIPDSTTANSFHTDASGNSWWGANVASGSSAANASISAAGLGTFKNILVGGTSIQYQLTNSGIFSFGDGSDGAATFDGVGAVTGYSLAGSIYTQTRDVYFTSATISTGVTVKPSGYRIFGTGVLTLNGTALIQRNGNNGNNGGDVSTGTAGTGGAALADGYLKGSLIGGAGGAGGHFGQGTDGTAGTATSNSIGSNGVAGGKGGDGNSSGGNAGAAGTVTASNVKLIANWHLATLLDISSTGSTVKFDNSAAAGGGGGGGGANDGVNQGGGGGGSGSAGGIIAIYFRSIVIGASASITATGGNGGNGGNGSGTAQGGGGGGSGGNGGQIILVYNVISNSGALTVTGGALGTKGTDGKGTGTNGTVGTAGTVRQFLISM